MKSPSRRTIIFFIVSLICCAILFQLFYTDKRSASGPAEAPLRWLNEETLLSSEEGSLFLRKQGEPRREFYSLAPQGAMFSATNACISEAAWWLGTWKRTVNGSVISGSNSGPILIEVETDAVGEISVKGTTQQARLARPIPATCQLDEAYDATTTFLRNNKGYQEDRRLEIDKKSYIMRDLSPVFDERRTLSGVLNSAPKGGHLYLHDRPRGLLTIAGDKVSIHQFSDEYNQAFGISRVMPWGYALWDRSLNQALFIQSACADRKENAPCTRKALWLTAELEPQNMIELPGDSLVEIKSGYSCFSCGCGCYSHQKIYVEGGNVFAHVWGYPVEDEKRGIYRLEQRPSGPVWRKIVSGRPQPPLSFSPSGEKVAYFELSLFGDHFVMADISEDD